jgi:hypothetical protein
MGGDLGTREPLIVGGCECFRFGPLCWRQKFSTFCAVSGCVVSVRENVRGRSGVHVQEAHHEGAGAYTMSPPATGSPGPHSTPRAAVRATFSRTRHSRHAVPCCSALVCRFPHWIGGAGQVPGFAATVSGSALATPSTETKGMSVFRLSFIVRMNSLAIMA